MKVRAPELAIRDAREPELFLEMNDVADGTILRGAQRLATDLAIPAPLACLEQLRRAEKTADMVGAERRLVAGGHRCFSWGLFAFPLMTDGRAIVKQRPVMPARSRFVLSSGRCAMIERPRFRAVLPTRGPVRWLHKHIKPRRMTCALHSLSPV